MRSKLQSDVILKDAKEKNRKLTKFTGETVELQIGMKNSQKDKRFSGGIVHWLADDVLIWTADVDVGRHILREGALGGGSGGVSAEASLGDTESHTGAAPDVTPLLKSRHRRSNSPGVTTEGGSSGGSDWDDESDSEVASVSSMAENDVLPSAMQARSGVGGMVGLPPSDVGSRALSWVVKGYNVEVVDGRFVPVCHLGLYRRVLERYGHLASGAVMEGMPRVLMAVVSETLDVIAEIEGVRDIELSRERVDVWLASLRSASIIGLSVGWLRSRVEELDRAVCKLELVAEASRSTPELARRMEVVMKTRAAAEAELEEVTTRVEKARDEEKEIQTAMAANFQVLDDADNEPALTGQSVLFGFL